MLPCSARKITYQNPANPGRVATSRRPAARWLPPILRGHQKCETSVILHGVENWRPREHWQWWLTDQLRDRGEQVLYPQLPSPSSPALDEWLSVLHGELAQLGT